MVSLLGIASLLLVAYLLSTDRGRINPRTVLGALAIQVFIGGFVLYFPPGIQMLNALAGGVANVLGYSSEGISFLFGNLNDQGWNNIGFVFAINVLPVIIFFASLIAVLYHIGVMGWVIRVIGGALQLALGTSRPESMSAAANIFVGQTEAPLVVKPFIRKMTTSELFAVMVGGLASIAGSVMAGYAAMGIALEYLLAACFMAAPGGLMMAKIIMPETGEPINELEDLTEDDRQSHVNIFDAAAAGALSGLQLALNVGAMLLAFTALIAMLNAIVGFLGGLVGFENVTIELLLGYLFQPVAWTLGIPWAEANLAGSLIGQKLVLTEFIAYLKFTAVMDGVSEHAQAIVTIALCGFANFASIAILLGGIGTLAPGRRSEIAQLGLRALVAATLANLMSAAIAGLFLSFG
ncbi:MAG: NupC/NupG family nucleoside CNT transporter [Proteobacteria bacterium]|nr:NupC/NupG family nucleoside CNT transporter [Pseudomonadota bacterium]MDA1300390.1 NupC/NupG family nucleoside CNT transporter [Pseudomonadota bacterium]